MRSESDVSAVANPAFPVAVLLQRRLHWHSAARASRRRSSASVFALAGNHATQKLPRASGLTGVNASKLNDITTGGINGSCPPAYPYICKPGAGYDGVTGWGSPNGVGAF